MTWRTARSLDTLLAEINRAAPKRGTVSDGSIGDPAHSSRVSDHNPNAARVVRARDFTHDPVGGLDCNVLAARLEALLRSSTHPALGPGAYIIWNDRIISRDRIREGWRPYGGDNPHTKHLHLSVATDSARYDSTQAWNLFPKPTTLPKRIVRYLAETKVELDRLRAARASAKVRGEKPEPYTRAIRRLRKSRQAAREVTRR